MLAFVLVAGVSAQNCTFVECERGDCDRKANPFLCLSETGPYMGCSAVGWNVATCPDSCTMKHCADRIPPTGLKSCRGLQCPAERCAAKAQQKCGSAAPYQCRFKNCSLTLTQRLLTRTNISFFYLNIFNVVLLFIVILFFVLFFIAIFCISPLDTTKINTVLTWQAWKDQLGTAASMTPTSGRQLQQLSAVIAVTRRLAATPTITPP